MNSEREATSVVRRAAFWVILVVMFVVGGIQAWYLQQAVNQRAATELRYSNAVGGSRQALWSWTVPQRHEEWGESPFWTGPNFFRVLKQDDDPWEPKVDNFMELVHPDDRPRVIKEMKASVASGQNFDSTYQLLTGDGRYVWVAAHGSMGEIDGRRVLSGSFVTIDDVMAERIRADMIVNSANEAVIMCGPNRLITVYNEAAERLFGWSCKDMVGTTIDRLITRDYLSTHQASLIRFADRMNNVDVSHDDFRVSRTGVKGEAITKLGEHIPVILDVHGIKYRGNIEFIAVIRRQPFEPEPPGIHPLRDPILFQSSRD